MADWIPAVSSTPVVRLDLVGTSKLVKRTYNANGS